MKKTLALILAVATVSVSANSFGFGGFDDHGNFRPHRPHRPGKQVQQLEIKMKGKLFTQQSVIKLKQEIKKTHPHINFKNWNLKKVTLVAKSARGYGQAYLKVGQYESRIETVDGNRFDFQERGNFHHVTFRAPGKEDKGNWQIHMQGKIKVRKVILEAVKKNQRPVMVQKQCKVLLETIWGKNIKEFKGQASGPKGSGVQAQACHKAMKKCKAFSSDLPLTQCVKL